MARKALVESERVRNAVLAVVMLLVLAASLGVAALVSTPASQVSMEWSSLSMNGLHLSVPSSWVEDQRESSGPLDAQTVLVDPTRAERRLLVGTARAEGLAGDVVLKQALLALVHPDALAAVHGRQNLQLMKQGALNIWTWRAADLETGSPRLHKLAVLSRDGQTWWVLYLVALVDDGMDPSAQIREDEYLFQVIVQRASTTGP